MECGKGLELLRGEHKSISPIPDTRLEEEGGKEGRWKSRGRMREKKGEREKERSNRSTGEEGHTHLLAEG